MNLLPSLPTALLLILATLQTLGQSPRIFVSHDHGASWTRSDTGFPTNATVNDFAVNQNIPPLVLAGTDSHGAFISTNHGQSWTPLGHGNNGLPASLKVNATAFLNQTWFLGTHAHGIFQARAPLTTTNLWAPFNTGLAHKNIRRLSISGDKLYAATDAGLFVSTHTTPATPPSPAWQHLHGHTQATGIAIHQNHIYYSDIQGILHSADHGQTFQRVNTDGTPHNLAHHGPSIFATFYGIGLKKSIDHGRTWLPADLGLPNGSRYTFQIHPIKNILLAAQWDGIYLSRDQGATWTHSSAGLPHHLSITDILPINDHTILAAAGLLKP